MGNGINASVYRPIAISSLSGTVRNLHNETLEYVNPEKPTHDHSSIYYKRFYVSSFNLNESAIKATFSAPMKIQDGDNVTVAGYFKGELFQVVAYANQTQATRHHENWLVLIVAAVIFFCVALGIYHNEGVIAGELIPKLLIFGFAAVSLYMAYRAWLIKQAIRLLPS